MSRFVAALAAALCLCAAPAHATSVSRTVPANKPSLLLPIIPLAGDTCTPYPPRDLKITVQPTKGVAAIIEKTVPLPAAFAQCKGTVVKAKLLVYQSRGKFTGTDHVSISFTTPHRVDESSFMYNTVDVEITVK
jgi:hypothetical protein